MNPAQNDDTGVPRIIAIAGAVLLILLLTGIAIFLAAHGEQFEFSAEQIAGTIRSLGSWAMAGSVLLMIAHSFVPLPAEFIAIANGMVFGVVLGTLITWCGAMAGAILAFSLARLFGRRFVQAILPSRYGTAIDGWTQEQGVPILLVSRLLPIVSFNLINYAAGLTSISWWTFLWTTGLGILPLTFLMVFIGKQMISGEWKLVLLLTSACVAVGLIAYVIAQRRK